MSPDGRAPTPPGTGPVDPDRDVSSLPVDARRLVARFGLAIHPEGGWYRRVVESARPVETPVGQRPAVTSILYLLTSDAAGRPHRVRNDEVWHFLAGDALLLAMYSPHGGYREAVLGGDGEYDFVHCVEGGVWQAAQSLGRWSLAGCTVAPGFDFRDFEIAAGDALESLLAAAPRMIRFVR